MRITFIVWRTRTRQGGDAMCSLRIRYHLEHNKRRQKAGVSSVASFSLLDNCCGQNKSNIVLQFHAMLAVLFLPHRRSSLSNPRTLTHDSWSCRRVVSWCYEGVEPLHPCWTGWSDEFSKLCKSHVVTRYRLGSTFSRRMGRNSIKIFQEASAWVYILLLFRDERWLGYNEASHNHPWRPSYPL